MSRLTELEEEVRVLKRAADYSRDLNWINELKLSRDKFHGMELHDLDREISNQERDLRAKYRRGLTAEGS